MRFRLTYLSEPFKGLTTDFDQEVVSIGRSVENDVVVDEVHVSGFHAKIENPGGQVVIKDLGSTNGTFVNGKKIKSPAILQGGETIQFGTQVQIKFTPLIEDVEDRTVIGTPEEMPDYIPQEIPVIKKSKTKKKFPIWIIIVVLAVVLICGGVIVLGGGGLLALNLFRNPESQTQAAVEAAVLETQQADILATQAVMTEAPFATGTAQAAAQQAQETAAAQSAATNSMIEYYWSLALDGMGTLPLFGPVSGTLAHTDDGNVESSSAGVSYQNAVIVVDFYPPYVPGQSQWDVGIFFRDLGSNDEMRLCVESDGTFFVLNRHGEEEEYFVNENINNLNLDINSPNTLVLMLWEDKGIFFLNGQFIKEFDISDRMEAGDVAVATNIVTENFLPGAETRFENFTIYALPVQ